MYYVMQKDMALTNRFVYFRQQPAEFDSALWRSGEKLPAPPAPMTLVAEDEKPTEWSDMLLAPSEMLVFSPRLLACMDAAGVGNLETFPIQLLDRKTGRTSADHRLVNVLGCMACLDTENADLTPFADGQGYMSVDEFGVLEDRIQPLPGTKGKPHLFRLAEFKFHLLADETVKTACEKAGITGVEFVPTPEYI